MHAHLFAMTLLLATPGDLSRDTQEEAEQILRLSNVKGGLIVHVNCGTAELTTALGAKSRCTVRGLEADPSLIDQARRNVRSSGQYGRVSIAHWSGLRLPFADNLVNLILAEQPGDVATEEMMRALAPLGVALIKQNGTWVRHIKPWPKTIDQWPHYLYGPDNNAVSHDVTVGPPQHMQWVCGPKYARSHEINSSMAGMVSAGGRLFYIWDEGVLGVADPRFPSKWALVARDGFNGVLLWKRPMPDWGWRQWHDPSRWDDKRDRAKMLRHLPATTPRRLVATPDRLFVTLGYEAPVSVLDTTSGKILTEIAGTTLTDEILFTDGLLILRVRQADDRPDKDVWDRMPKRQSGHVMAVDAESGMELWTSPPEEMAPLTLATRGTHVYYSNYRQVVCLDRSDGRELWRTDSVEGAQGHRGTAGTLIAQDDVVLYAGVPEGRGNNLGQVRAYASATGELLWTGPKYSGPGVTNPPDLFVADGLVWLGETRLPVNVMETNALRKGYDPLTGRVVRQISVPKLTSPGHHYRCYRSKATEHFLLLPKRGVEFLDLIGDDHMRNDWLRAPCIYGVLPSNGMLYLAPHQCVCYQGVLLSNFNAVSATPAEPVNETRPKDRLRRGPAWDEVDQGDGFSAEDWPMYRCNSLRSGSVATNVADNVTRRWAVKVGDTITPPVIADGRVVLADKETHTVYALDSDTGRALWSYSAGGRIDSPPTLHQSLVLFGSSDGWLYCLRAADGKLVWRFQAAPFERDIVGYGQVESAWPLHGSVLIQEDKTTNPARPVVYCTAGRSSFLDGGIHIYGLLPDTGQVVYHTRLSGPRPDPMTDTGGAGYMDGCKTDILTSDGADLFLFQERLSSNLTRHPAPMQAMAKERGGFRVFPSAPERGSSAKHLISTRGFLDDSYNEGTYWTYGDRWPGWDRHMNGVPAYGQILSFDQDQLFGVHVFTESVRVRRGFFPATKGYRLYSRHHGASKDKWSVRIPMRVRAMVATRDALFIAGPPDAIPKDDPLAALEGRLGASLWAIARDSGETLADISELKAPPVYDGLAAADGRLYVSLTDGRVICFARH